MKPQQITLFSASAGSGKTFTLTVEYIKMALSEVETKGYFRRILAVTFTIKAAEEMRQRILYFLAGIAEYPTFATIPNSDQPKFVSILDKIQSELAAEGVVIEKLELVNRAKITLQQILQDYGLFSVMTIDSFVQRLSASFIDELNLPTQYDVLLDSNQLIHELINRLLDQVNNQGDPELTELILSFANQEIKDGRNWNRIRDSLHAFLKISLDEKFLVIEPQLASFQVVDFLRLEDQLRASMADMVKEIRDIATAFLAIVDGLNLEDSVYYYGVRGPVGIMRSVALNPEVADKSYSYLRSAIKENTWSSGKASVAEKASIELISSELSALGSKFLEFQELQSKRYNFIHWVLKDLKKMALLNMIQKEMNAYQQDQLAIPISEFAKKVYQVISKDPIPFIYEKLGDRYFHIFIDEFQDTSILQWKNFMPLIENSTSLGKKSLLVGDAKQAIYKFRGGEVSLIASLSNKDVSLVSSHFEEDSLDEHRFDYLLNQVSTQALSDNYRSAKEIVEFNNAFYQSLANNESLTSLSSLIKPLYGNNLIQNPKVVSTDFSGKVDLVVYRKSKENFGFTEPENEFMFEQVLNLIQHNLNLGFRYQDLAILTRKNKHSRYLALRLKERGIPVISSDSLLVHYSPNVGFLLSFLSIQANPNETLLLYELVYQFAEIKGAVVENKDLEFLAQLTNDNALEKAIHYFSFKGYTIPLFSDLLNWVYDLISVLDLLNHSSGQDYLWKFLDILNDYVVLNDKSVGNFLQHFNLNRNSYCISSSSQENAVTISSIHKSKGLEYPVVIVPFVNWTFVPDAEKIWFDLSEVLSPDLALENSKKLNVIYGRVNATEPAVFPSLVEQIKSEKDTILLDALNMLYVATTRPKQALHLILAIPDAEMHNRTITTFENSVGKLLIDFAETQGSIAELPNYLQTETAWPTSYFNFSSSAFLPKVPNNNEIEQNKNVQVRLQEIQPSIHFRVNTSHSDLYTSASKKREIGNQLHDLLAQLPDMDSWPSLRANTKIDVSKLDDLLAIDTVQAFFKKDLLAFKEVDLLCPDGSIVRPDRVNKVGNDLQVIDFKTGKPKPEHHLQINKYKQTLIAMGHSVCQGVLIYVDSKELEYV